MQKPMSFISVILLLFALVLAGCGREDPASAADKTKTAGGTTQTAAPSAPVKTQTLTIAEPVHSVGYLPLYVAIQKGFFQGIDVKVTTLAGGSAHTNAVLSGQAWGFIGGPEHNAFAKVKGADIRAIVNVVNRGNVYLVARPGLKPDGDLKAFLQGKVLVTQAYGGTPNSITRYLLVKLGMDVKKDVTLQEVDNAAIPAILKQGKGDIAIISEPMVTAGIKEGIWQEPFYNVPKELGEYAYSTVNIKLDSIQKDPATVKAFVEGMMKGLAFVRDNKAGSLDVAKKEFPTMDLTLLQATLDRSYADELWEFSGKITPKSIDTDLAVVTAAGMLKETITFDQIVDMQFLGK